MTRRFTGWHMTIVLLAMFGVIIAVNVVMASFAIGTFGGTVVDNSYVASQQFNRWLGEARAQKQLHWSVDATIRPDRIVAVTAKAPQGPMDDAIVTVVATHPLGRLPEQQLAFRRDGEGRFVATRPLPAGRWVLLVEVRDHGREARFDDEVPA